MNGLLLADDLSGLLDAAAAFDTAGAEVKAVLEPDALIRVPRDVVAAVSTETRNSPASAARDAIRNVLAAARAQGRELLFKKIDSTLRGPVAAELAALTDFFPGVRILFAPANPSAGRTVRDGILRVHGVPVAETEFGRDPGYPVRSSSLHELLGEANSSDVVIPDAETQADLAAAVKRMDESGHAWVAVGSGALAQAVAQHRDRTCAVNRPAIPHEWRVAPSPILMVCGSKHSLNRMQAEQLRVARGVLAHELNAINLANGLRFMREDFASSGGAAILLPTNRLECHSALPSLVASAEKIVIEHHIRRIFVTGGETAFALCRALEISLLTFLSEIETGVTLSYGTGVGGPFLLAIKPGGFGDDATWVRAWDRLRDT